MGVSLSNKPWVSRMITDSNSPLLLETSKGSDQTVMPVVMRFLRALHSKASFCEFTPSFALPSDKRTTFLEPVPAALLPERYLSTSVSRKDFARAERADDRDDGHLPPGGTFFSTSSKQASSSTNA